MEQAEKKQVQYEMKKNGLVNEHACDQTKWHWPYKICQLC